MFNHLGLKNFRAFEQVALDLAPITILVGPNNSGKSSIIGGLRILAQTATSDDLRNPLLLNGPLGDFGTYKDLVFEHNRRRRIGITVATGTQRGQTQSRLELTFAYRPQRREVILRDSALFDGGGHKVFSTTYSQATGKHVGLFSWKQTDGTVWSLPPRPVRMFHFVAPIWEMGLERYRSSRFEESATERRRMIAFGERGFSGFLQDLRSIEYVGPFRASPQRTNLFTGERPIHVGMDGARAIDLLAADYLRRGRQKKRLSNQIIGWFRAAEIAGDIKIRVLSDRHFEMLIQHPVTQEYENLADVGYGNSQVLPVLAGGYNLPSGVTYIVEQPEIHLHPKAQAELGEFFADLYHRGVQSIVETHSEHLILRLQTHVAGRRINHKDIVLYYVHAPGKAKEVVKLTLNENGDFNEKWPRGFFEERMEEITALSRAPFGAAT